MKDGEEKRKARILLMEDCQGDVTLIRMALQDAGVDFELMVIDDGGEALALARQQGKYAGTLAPDLAILDLNLPKSDGLEILEAMRSNREFADMPVAVLSSSSSPRDRARMEVYRIVCYITKPPDLEEYMKIGHTLKQLLAGGTSRETKTN